MSNYYPKIEDIKSAAKGLKGVINITPLMKNLSYSKHLDSNILFKREDLQVVRSYKIRGAYNRMYSLSDDQIHKGIVCASAGNHAQGVALSCKLLKAKGTIYMPAPTPKQKIQQVKMFGQEYVEIVLEGDTFDDSYYAAMQECKRMNKAFIHPFNDEKVIEGQGNCRLRNIRTSPIFY